MRVFQARHSGLSYKSQNPVHPQYPFQPYTMSQGLSQTILGILTKSDIMLRQLLNIFLSPHPLRFPFPLYEQFNWFSAIFSLAFQSYVFLPSMHTSVNLF